MDKKDIIDILRIVITCLQGKKFSWRLEGSANLLIQSVDVSVKDLDITTDEDGLAIFRNALKNDIVSDQFNEKIQGHSLVCNINGFEVEINSYEDKTLLMFDKCCVIEWENLLVPILPLNHAKLFYELINRKEKVDLISKHLK